MVYGVNGQAVSADQFVGWGQKQDNDPVPMVQLELTLIAQASHLKRLQNVPTYVVRLTQFKNLSSLKFIFSLV